MLDLHAPSWVLWLVPSHLLAWCLDRPDVARRATAAALRIFSNSRALVRFLKGSSSMNVLTLIPAALTIGEDLVKLSTDLATANKADAVAAVLDALPAIASLTGKPLADLQAILTPENIGAAFEAEQAAAKIVVAVEAFIATHASAIVPQVGETAPIDGETAAV